MRTQIKELLTLGVLPDSRSSVELIQRFDELLRGISPPVTHDEARALVRLFRKDEDETFGLAWTVRHLVETAPHWPLEDCLRDTESYWINHLRGAAERGGYVLD
jgi:hypothetical protein